MATVACNVKKLLCHKKGKIRGSSRRKSQETSRNFFFFFAKAEKATN